MFVEIQTRRSLPNFTMFKVVFVIMLALSSVARSRADSFFEETIKIVGQRCTGLFSGFSR